MESALLPILFVRPKVEASHNMRGNTGNNTIFRDILHYDRASRDDRSGADCDSLQDHRVSAQPGVMADPDWGGSNLRNIMHPPCHNPDWMKVRVIYLHSSSDIHMVLYRDIAGTENDCSRDCDITPDDQLRPFADRREHRAMGDSGRVLINFIIYRDIRTELYARPSRTPAYQERMQNQPCSELNPLTAQEHPCK